MLSAAESLKSLFSPPCFWQKNQIPVKLFKKDSRINKARNQTNIFICEMLTMGRLIPKLIVIFEAEWGKVNDQHSQQLDR
jgi:hypothetical protein